MSERNVDLDMIEAAFSQFGYPQEFLGNYDQMECLSSHKGRETFLVKRKSDGCFAVAKCYDRALYALGPENTDATEEFDFPGLPRYLARYANEKCVCVVREYIEGTPLSAVVKERELSQKEIVDVCLKLCDILGYLHTRPEPVIHRDVKPENVILTESGDVWLIDFDIARTFKPGAESDTLFFGTKGYAPPEQYGFAQTDARTDVYSLGVLLRFLLTGSVRENKNIRMYRPLEKVISKCTAFAPEKRYRDMKAVKRALLAANPRSQLLRSGGIVFGALVLCAVLAFAGVEIYRAVTYTPFSEGAVPAYLSDGERVADAVAYMKGKYGTSMFDAADDVASVGDLRAAMIDLYGLDRDYVYGINEDMPQESDAFFLPWGWDDGQTVDRDIMVYAAVKAHDPSIVADWSRLKDDNGYYPGVRVAMAFAEETGIMTGANRPGDITLGEMALILANADRVFDAADPG